MLYRASLLSESEITETEEFKTLKRMLGEQTDNDDFDDLKPVEIKAKDAEELDSTILQNPSDPDATYRLSMVTTSAIQLILLNNLTVITAL